ncbi:uncharacterized protein LOC111004347 [Pieris rapae]|uniref:uncharacterized protein LOC111004347 n=1 Tax=Pieris rapae TaxID=64459 RepID=UPI001E27E664|nr:uncharacterized protein LOC111004347 [Pieris rapae]
MKRVRFASPLKVRDTNIMNYDTECHSPRPFIEKQTEPLLSSSRYNGFGSPRLVSYTNDPVQKFEFSNCLPYPTVNKTHTPNYAKFSGHGLPSSDLDLSMLDSACQEPRSVPQKIFKDKNNDVNKFNYVPENILKPVDSYPKLPNTLNKNDNFFLKRENIAKLNAQQPLPDQINIITLEKENNPFERKKEIINLGTLNQNENVNKHTQINPYERSCNCHHCPNNQCYMEQHCFRSPRPCLKANYVPHFPPSTSCDCHSESTPTPLNAISKKTWEIEKYEQSKKSDDLSINVQSSNKEKREPTVSDLFQIIKLQNEQLQLLQEKVDRFIASTSKNDNLNPKQKCLVDQTCAGSNEEHHKISIGVMTSFEMVRTSTVINKEIIKQNEAQIQCNRSQISIKEVVSKSQPVNINFLDGIQKKNDTDTSMHDSLFVNGNITKNTGFEDKTFNELSLYNLQVNNDTTPQMSPEPSLYLDVKDYSDTDTDSDDPANVGWTYYNKVMTRVNGLLQDSDMPSSASALYRNTRRLMQIDKTNVSVTKRVTFGENPIQPRAPSTDTSLKMNQLAAKYLNNGLQVTTKPANDLSFATKSYMEKHKIIQGNQGRPQQELPKFLDVTVLKQQQKLL